MDSDAKQDPNVTYRALCTIDRDKDKYLPGSILPPLPAETAARLLAMDPPAIELVREPSVSAMYATYEKPAPSESSTGADKEPVKRANAKDTIARVASITDVADLIALQTEEEEHADGARTTVIAAIEARFSALADDQGASQ